MFTCEECNNEMIYCSGELRNPYLRHKAGNLCKSNGGESTQHKLCKKIIKESLENGNNFEVNKYCDCKSNIIEIKLNEGETINEEYREENNIYDLVILNGGEIRLVIEIYHTHKQKRERDFIELKTSEILSGNKSFNYKVYCDDCDPIKLRERFDYIGIQLEIISYSNDMIESCWDIAINGKCNVMKKYYHLENFKRDNILWNTFLEFQRCFKCLKTHNTLIYKPYCVECYKKIINTEDNDRKINLDQFKTDLRYIFNRLTLPSGEIKHFDLCKICNNHDCENLFYWNKAAKNRYKHICYSCLLETVRYDQNFILLYNEIKAIREKYIM